jgi:NAD(P)-dependent dehydrogenase (short-subunit alcohol dehydrogenase family)
LAIARKAHGVERILVNCAGIGPAMRTVSKKRDTGELVAHDIKFYTKVVSINLIGTFTMIAKSAVAMSALEPVTDDGGRGCIINTASVAATDGQIGQVAYASSKGGVLGLTLPVARDLANVGIRVNTIMPGLFETPMFLGVTPEFRKTLEASVPFPSRLGRPDEYAHLAKAIIENDMMNGFALRLDGAVRMAPK